MAQLMEVIKQKTISLDTRAIAIMQQAKDMLIQDDVSQGEAVQFLTQIAMAKKDVDAQRRFFTDPMNNHVKTINGLFKGYSGPLDESDQVVRRKLTEYHIEQKRIAREAQEAAIAEAESTDADDMIIESVMQVEQPDKTVRVASGSATMRDVWAYEIVDPAQIPEEYKVIDEKRIAAVVKAGVRNIPGVKIFQKQEVTVRTR